MADFDEEEFSTARFLTELVQAVNADFKDLHKWVHDSLAEQKDVIHEVQQVAGRMEHTERLMAKYAPAWDQLHDDLKVWTATRGQQLEQQKRDLERLQAEWRARREEDRKSQAEWRERVESGLKAQLEKDRATETAIETAKIGRSERVFIALLTAMSGLIGAILSRLFQ